MKPVGDCIKNRRLGLQSEPSIADRPACFRLLGIPVSIVTMERAVGCVTRWASGAEHRIVFVREVASLMVTREDPVLRALHECADLVVPDGMPLVWAGRLNGFGTDIGRVSGADLMDAVCQRSVELGQSHYFFGGKLGVADAMAARLVKRYPGLNVVGHASPPMRDIGPDFQLVDEALHEVEAIRAADPDFIWVGMSSPKQEYWIARAAVHCGRGVFFGVGAAFDFHSGAVRRAPVWMQRNGLEWLHRLASEPRRLWRRYLLLAPRFVGLAVVEQIGKRL